MKYPTTIAILIPDIIKYSTTTRETPSLVTTKKLQLKEIKTHPDQFYWS